MMLLFWVREHRIINRSFNFVVILRKGHASKEQSQSENEHTSASLGGGAKDPERFGGENLFPGPLVPDFTKVRRATVI
jgi:hypothetical protein